MKTISVYPKFRLALIGVLGFELIVHQSSAQLAENQGKATEVRQTVANTDDDTNKKPPQQEKEAIIDRSVDDKDDATNQVSLTGSDGNKSIDITLVAGERKSNTVTIHNPGDSSVEWEVSLDGEAGVLYRIRRAGQRVFMCDKMDPAAETAGDRSSRDKSAYPDVNGFAKGLDDGSPVLHFIDSDGLKDGSAIEHSHEASGSRRLTDAQVKSAIMADGKDPFHVLWQWYHVLDCGYPRFAPTVDILEISDDNGEHWRQILPMGDRSLVLNATCINPARFIERFKSNGGKPDGYNALFLADLLAEVRRRSAGLTVQPRSGVVPANGNMDITLACDADVLESDMQASSIILKTKGPTCTEIVVPFLITVLPKSGNDPARAALRSGQPGIEQIPEEYALHQNFPNPFNPSTTIKFDLPEASRVTMTVYDVLGRRLFLANGQFAAGRYGQLWDGRNSNGIPLASGVYFCRLEAQSLVSQRNLKSVMKMVLMK
jgi:hypothetical protein